MTEENKSVGWVAAMLALTIAYFTWAFLAADFFQNRATNGAASINFWLNSLLQIPNFFRILSYTFNERFWAVVLFGVLEVGVLILWRVMKKLEQTLWG